MKKIKIERLSLLNFKGIKSNVIYFSEDITKINGANATGKSTINDAFCWLLFGKDAIGRTAFGIKTIDKSTGKEIPKLSHEVEGVFKVGNDTYTLRRTYTEVWTTKRGSAVETFSGHNGGYFVNEVPVSAGEFSSTITNIFPEQIFKLITNPLYFCTLKKEEQRKLLIGIIDIPTESEMLMDERWAVLREQLNSGVTLAGKKKEIAGKKKRLKSQIDEIPPRLNELDRMKPEKVDFSDVEARAAAITNEVEGINLKCKDLNLLRSEEKNDIDRKERDLNRLKAARFKIVKQMDQDESERFMISYNEWNNNKTERMKLQSKRNSLNTQIAAASGTISQNENELELLRARWNQLNADVFVLNDDDLNCPTCKQILPNPEGMLEELKKTFNERKSLNLAANKENGVRLKQSTEIAIATLEKAKTDLADIEAKLEEPAMDEPVRGVVDYNSNSDIIAIDNEIDMIEDEIKVYHSTPSDLGAKVVALTEEKDALMVEFSSLNAQLKEKEYVIDIEDRIEKLNIEMDTLRQEYADQESIEMDILEFSILRSEMIEEKVNTLFKEVRFRLFETQINGEIIETCEAMVDSVPYSDLNSAMKINAGLDIINTFCDFYDTAAPIFIDNAESVNEFYTTQSQMILLTVTEDKYLVIN